MTLVAEFDLLGISWPGGLQKQLLKVSWDICNIDLSFDKLQGRTLE